MDLFSEVYGCYYTVIARLLEKAQNGISKTEMETLVNSQAFCDSAFHLLPKLLSGEWNLLEKKTDGRYYALPKLSSFKRPMTTLEHAWLKTIFLDKRILLFVTPSELETLNASLPDIEPLYHPEDFHSFDSAADGDPYDNEEYIQNFRTVLKACIQKQAIQIVYKNSMKRQVTKTLLPYKLTYSNRDDKFRLLGVTEQNGEHRGITLNLARIRSVTLTPLTPSENIDFMQLFTQSLSSEPILLEISRERKALERCMLQFASWEKLTEYDEEKDNYLCKIFYDKQDETELLIRILSFGPVIKVLGPEGFLNQVKERIRRQYQLNWGDDKIV
jgi:predicted DNA-binding transcriptional regulator YafY